ncbi:CheR family methyltransferase [Aerosakkonema funiforme]|uniref:protein-glutamate O-methyltransferase n=2 Tax=Oscillatoriophycideae TaxID=1301283 RepID=A0A926VKA0_9CYAN|nr:CheR family methyltransferase [Aerosakkonema funiforme]MBD2185263.1 PAS domain S-box protein [Aerosakkonema funiforme FACHB-1375]
MSIAPKDEQFETLLQYLKQSRGFDFTGYKRPSLMRLTKKRMQRVDIESYSDYLDYLQVHPAEVNHLFDALLINVTAFFRDTSAWQALANETIPRIMAAKPDREPIRVWTAGCATGEEAYTIAIVLAEILGAEGFRSRVKIYATDLDEEALNCGRQATYSSKGVQELPEELRRKYFDVSGRDTYTFRNDFRRCVIFGRHDLVQHAPIPRLDLLICRNTLMYFTADTQARILARFHFGLIETGFLFVGKAEMLLTHANLFQPANLKYRIFSKVATISMRDRLLVMADSGNTEASNQIVANMRLRDEAIENNPVAQIVVDVQGNLVLANRSARILFGLTSHDLGRPLQDLELSYRPAELRSRIDQAYAERRSVVIPNVELMRGEDNITSLEIQVIPLLETNADILGVSIVFNDITRYSQLERELQRSTQELETAYEELQSSNEELETTNEELQSTNEELETTNEELQSTNEELETMNEELQSSNEELHTTNEELRLRTEELNRVNIFFDSVLISLRIGMVVLDNRLSVQLWNNGVEDLWGLRAEEAMGRFFFDLDIGLPVEKLRGSIRAAQPANPDEQELILDAVNRRGKNIRCRVICTSLIVGNQPQGIILLMDERLE